MKLINLALNSKQNSNKISERKNKRINKGENRKTVKIWTKAPSRNYDKFNETGENFETVSAKL